MAVGDLIRGGPLRHDVNLLAFEATLPEDTPIDFAIQPLFERPSRWFGEQLLLQWSRGTNPLSRLLRSATHMSLLDLIDVYHDMETLGADGERESVAVPFSHVILRCAPGRHFSGERRIEIENGVTEQIRGVFGRYIDQLVDVRVRCEEHDELDVNKLVVLFGRGVFLPRWGERPVGHVRILVQGMMQSSRDLCLADGTTAAGIYRGQRAVALGDGALAPGQALLDLAAGEVLSIAPDRGATTRKDADGRSVVRGGLRLVPFAALPGGRKGVSWTLRVLNYFRRGRESSGRATAHGASTTPIAVADADGAWLLSTSDLRCEIRAVIDERPSRLHLTPPDGRSLEIVGVAVDPRAGQPGTTRDARWWINVDAEGRLVGSAMAVMAYSITVEDDVVESYDWRRKDWTRGPSSIRFGLDEDGVLRRLGGGALGYLAMPSGPAVPRFQDEWWLGGTDAWPLDWLDFAGAVQMEDEDPVGLAAWSAHCADATIPAAVASQEIRIGPLVVAKPRSSEVRRDRAV